MVEMSPEQTAETGWWNIWRRYRCFYLDEILWILWTWPENDWKYREQTVPGRLVIYWRRYIVLLFLWRKSLETCEHTQRMKILWTDRLKQAGDIFAAVMSAPHRCLLFDILQGPHSNSGEEFFYSSVLKE